MLLVNMARNGLCLLRDGFRANLIGALLLMTSCASMRGQDPALTALHELGDCVELPSPVPVACGNATVGGIMTASTICQAHNPDRWMIRTNTGQTFTWLGAECITILPGAF